MPPTSANPTPQQAGRPAAPLFGIAALAFGVLLLFTLLTLTRMLNGGDGVDALPFITAIGTVMVGRAAWAMRPRPAS